MIEHWQQIAMGVALGAAVLFLVRMYVNHRRRRKGCDNCVLVKRPQGQADR